MINRYEAIHLCKLLSIAIPFEYFIRILENSNNSSAFVSKHPVKDLQTSAIPSPFVLSGAAGIQYRRVFTLTSPPKFSHTNPTPPNSWKSFGICLFFEQNATVKTNLFQPLLDSAKQKWKFPPPLGGSRWGHTRRAARPVIWSVAGLMRVGTRWRH